MQHVNWVGKFIPKPWPYRWEVAADRSGLVGPRHRVQLPLCLGYRTRGDSSSLLLASPVVPNLCTALQRRGRESLGRQEECASLALPMTSPRHPELAPFILHRLLYSICPQSLTLVHREGPLPQAFLCSSSHQVGLICRS